MSKRHKNSFTTKPRKVQMMVSEKFRATIKLGPVPAYRIAQQAQLNPATLSKLMCGIEKVKPQDPRVLKVAAVIGLRPEECFEDEGAVL